MPPLALVADDIESSFEFKADTGAYLKRGDCAVRLTFQMIFPRLHFYYSPAMAKRIFDFGNASALFNPAFSDHCVLVHNVALAYFISKRLQETPPILRS